MTGIRFWTGLLVLTAVSCKTAPTPPPADLGGAVAKTVFKISISKHHPVPKSGAVPAEQANQMKQDVWKGEPGKTYRATFRVRGIVEPRLYEGGAPDPASPFVQVGGIPSDVRGEHGRQYAVFKIEVSDPKQVYYLNKDHSKLADHEVYAIDYRLKVDVRTGATVSVVLADQPNSGAIANHRDLVVPGVPPEVVSQPFKDQFLLVELDGVDVAAN